MWRLMVIALSLFVLSSTADAQNAPATQEQVLKMRWGHPSTRENGSGFNAATELANYRINWSVNDEEQPAITVPPTRSTHDLTVTLPLRAEPHRISMTVTAIDKDGLNSKPSNQVVQQVVLLAKSPPSAPGSASLLIECRDCTVRVIP